MKVLTVGAGAVGAFFSSKLAAAGAEVATVVRKDFDAVAAHGFQFHTPEGDYTFRPAAVLHHASEYPEAPDLVICAAKVLPEIDVAALLGEAGKRCRAILLLQNGLEIEPPFRKAFPDTPLLSAVVYGGVTRLGGGRITRGGPVRLEIGVYPVGTPEPAILAEIRQLFAASGITCIVTPDVVQRRWIKLLWNTPFNAISVLGGGLSTKKMVNDPEVMLLARTVMRELQRIAGACGKTVTDDDVEHMIDFTIHFPDYKPSMLVDFEAGRPMEVEAITGAPLTLARQHGISAPALMTLHALLAGVDREARRARS